MSAQPQLERLSQLIEGFKAQPVLREETLVRIGETALCNGLLESSDTTSSPVLSSQQFSVVECASLGYNTKQAAQNLSWPEQEVVEVREQLLALHRVPEMSGVINQTMQSGKLPIKIEETNT